MKRMEKRLLKIALLICFCSNLSWAADGDTTIIRSHDQVDMVWNQRYTQKALFPDGSKTYRKILFRYELGCASGGCSDWDYLTMAYIQKPITDSTFERIHLASLVTPYANGYSSNWSQDFVLDITDYATQIVGQPDSVEIGVWYDGWSAGFSATFDFIFIEGTPPRDPKRTIPLYYSGYGGGAEYGNPTNSIENFLTEQTVTLLPGEECARLHFTATGHSFGQDPCAEFCPKNYYLNVNGAQVASNGLLSNCGDNPNFPQPGTWLYDRAGWCPGEIATRWEHELTDYMSPNSSNTIDIDMEAHVYNGGNNFAPNYKFGTVLHTLGAPNFENDAELLKILSPSTEFDFNRFNPTCSDAEVMIKNNGGTPLTSLTIRYGVEGGDEETYYWSGNLKIGESERVVLPLNTGDYLGASSNKIFHATVENPNGQTDEWVLDNTLSSTYETPLVMDQQFIVRLSTNSAANETSYTVIDDNGNLVYSKDNLTNNTLYQDTLDLPAGCYKLEVLDSGGDGLNFFANNDGSGSIQLRVVGGGIYRSYNSNFGEEITEYFTTTSALSTQNIIKDDNIYVYPNPSNALVNVLTDLTFDKILLYDMNGRRVGMTTSNSIAVDALQNGSYILVIEYNGNAIERKKISVQH